MPDIFRYDDYRAFLRDWLDESTQRSTEGLSRRLGCAKSYVSMIRNGRRSLPVGRAPLWAVGMRLGAEEALYWALLVQEADESAPDLQEEARVRRQAIQSWKSAVAATHHQRLYGSWVYQAILELSRCNGFRSDPEWIAGVLQPRVHLDEVKEAIAGLLELGLLTASDGALLPTDDSQATGIKIDDRTLSLLATELHESTLERARDALHSVPPNERFFSTITVALAQDQIAALGEQLRILQVEALQAVADRPPDQVFQLALTLVPCTSSTRRES